MDCDMEIDYDSPITPDIVHRWRSYVAPFPLPPHVVPMGGAPLRNIDEELLLSTPPAMIAHVQRTASQGGLQVVSPRQAPFSSLLNRRAPGPAKLGDHEVGSMADPNAEWPTLDGANMDFLLPDQPLAPVQEEIPMRPKTRTVSLTKGASELADPVLACLVRGRAVVDILKREDVAGGADEMAALLAEAWGVKEEELMELDGYTLGVEGDLQRHAMKVDEVYPTLYAPVHIRSVISMGVSDVDKSVLLPDMAMDWRRMRVFCEAVFYLCCAVEGLPVKYMRGAGVPGTRGGNRSNMLVFCPGAATAWCCSPESFSLMPVPKERRGRTAVIPTQVRDALQKYIRKVRPVSSLLAGGSRVNTWTSTAAAVDHPLNETLASSYSVVSRTMATGSFRGKRAAAAVRNAMYQVMEAAPLAIRTRMARYLILAPSECKKHLGSEVVPEIVVRELARRFCELGKFMRDRLSKEAERRGENVTLWWNDVLAQAPGEYADMGDTPQGWACVAVWTAFREPTDRWAKLKHAVTFRALAAAAVDSIGTVPLPAEKGSIGRLQVAVQHGVKGISKSFAGFYMGVADVGMAIAKAAAAAGRSRTAFHLREGSYLWNLRARSLRALNVSVLAHDEKMKSTNHIRVSADPVDVVLKPAPYMAFHAWRTHVQKSTELPASTKKMVEDASEAGPFGDDVHVKSSVFGRMHRPILVCGESTVTRYLMSPVSLGRDLEAGWQELADDVRKIVRTFAQEAETERGERKRKQVSFESVDILGSDEDVAQKRGKVEGEVTTVDYWEAIAALSTDEAMGIEEDLMELPEEIQALVMEGEYSNAAHVVRSIAAYREAHEESTTAMGETVR